MRETCKDFRRSFLQGEIDPNLDEHTTECPECRHFKDMEHRTIEVVRTGRPRWTASSSLRERVVATLEAEREAGHRTNPRRLWTRRNVLLFAGLTATAAATVLFVAPGPLRNAGHRRAHSTAELLVDDHLKYARRSDHNQLTTSSPAELQGWFEHQVELAAKLPDMHGARLVGGRRCSVQGRPAALAFYEKIGDDGRRSEPLSLFVFEPRGEDWSEMEEVPGLGGKRLCHHHQRGVGLLIWEERGLVYAVAGALEADELRALVAPTGE